jgi:hypothetical protein
VFFRNEHLFSPEFRTCYNNFMDSCFFHSRLAEDARLKAQAAWIKEQRSHSGWENDWDARFVFMATAESKKQVREQMERYWTLMNIFAEDLGVLPRPSVGSQRRVRPWASRKNG